MAPAVNIHRTPYSGRNFEYYSEDGFQAGKALGLMVSMNRIGNTFSGNSSALCIDLLRKE